MITITFNPQTPQQAAVVASAIGAYMSASADATTLNEQQAKDLADAATNRADDAAREALQAERAAKKPRAAKAAAAQDSASATGTSETTSQPAPTPTATTAETEGNDAAVSSEPAATAASPASSTAPAVSLEQVRAKLAALSQGGKAAEVKSLIGEFGVAKLTEIPSEKYGELLAKAEALA